MTLLAAPEPLILHRSTQVTLTGSTHPVVRIRRFPALAPLRRCPGGPVELAPDTTESATGEDIEDIGASLAALGAAPDTGVQFLSALTVQDHEVALLARALAAATFESLIGQRPVQQLARWYSPDCLAKLSRRRDLLRDSCPDPGARSFHCPWVRQVRVSRLSETIYEAAIVVDEKTSVRAAALRLERWRGRWLATALEIG